MYKDMPEVELKENACDFSLDHLMVRTRLQVNEPINTRTLTINNVVLSYDANRFEQNPAAYAAEQLKSHQAAYDIVSHSVLVAHAKRESLIGEYDFYEDAFMDNQLEDEATDEISLLIRRVVMVITTLPRFKTPKTHLEESARKELNIAKSYALIHETIKYGTELVNGQMQNTQGQALDDLKALLQVQEKLLGAYAELSRNSVKISEMHEQMQKKLYPIKKPLQ